MKLSDISQINMKTKRLNRLHKKHADQALASLGIHIGQSLILEVLLAKEACTQKKLRLIYKFLPHLLPIRLNA